MNIDSWGPRGWPGHESKNTDASDPIAAWKQQPGVGAVFKDGNYYRHAPYPPPQLSRENTYSSEQAYLYNVMRRADAALHQYESATGNKPHGFIMSMDIMNFIESAARHTGILERHGNGAMLSMMGYPVYPTGRGTLLAVIGETVIEDTIKQKKEG